MFRCIFGKLFVVGFDGLAYSLEMVIGEIFAFPVFIDVMIVIFMEMLIGFQYMKHLLFNYSIESQRPVI